jgi:phage terminase large subunit GpA-like protein
VTTETVLRKIVTPKVQAEMDRQLCKSIRSLIPHRINRLKVSEWAEAHRILHASVTPRPGPFRFSVVPFMKEIADCFSESSPIWKVVVMKGAQVSFTTAILENVIGYIIAAAPGPALFVSADKGVAETSVEIRLDAMIQSAGLADRIFAQTTKKHGKATGNTKARKDFVGGFLMAIGPRVGAKLRSTAVRYLLGDELEAWPQSIGGADKGKTADEGDTLALAEKRTVSFMRTRKILYGSTPLIKQTSRIEGLFLQGDQRYFEVPCPKCKHMQRLRWRDDEGKFRLKFEKDNEGRIVPDSVHYECEKCGAPWKNDDKAWFLPRGEWRPTAVSRELGLRSYHISALYSPLGMQTWEAICQEFVGIGDDVAKLRTFINTVLGETFEEKGWAPHPERIKARNAEDYHAGQLPETARPLVLTAGVDVQDDRLAVEVIAWGRDMESWSISYEEIPGDTSDLTSEAWKGLHALFNAKHAGFDIDAVLIDEGGHRTEQVRHFCEGFGPGVRAVKGDPWRRGAGIFSRRDIPGHDRGVIMLNVDALKEVVYGFVVKGTPDGLPPREPFPGYCHFPLDYSESYYKMLASEERFLDRGRDGQKIMRWRKVHTRNEALDCRVYGLGALYVFFDDWRRDVTKEDETEQAHGWGEFWGVGEERQRERVGAARRIEVKA